MANERLYAVLLTHAAQVDAMRYPGGAEAVEARARSEISDYLKIGLGDVSNLAFHMLTNESGPEFLCVPNETGDLIIDAVEPEREETEPLDTGPYAGYTVAIPKGFST